MTDNQSPNAAPSRLSEDAAHRLLARAIELDHSRSSETSVADLRNIAQEAGISAEAFDLALREIATRVPTAPAWSYSAPWLAVRSLWNSLRGRDASVRGSLDTQNSDDPRKPTIWEAAVSNAVAVPLIWLLLFLLTRIAQPIGWQAMEVAILLGCVLGAGIARKLRARIVEIGFTGMAAFQAAELVMHLMFGIRTVQGGPTHVAVIIAGILGVAVGMRTGRRDGAARAGAKQPVVIAPNSSQDVEAAETRPNAPLQTLRLRLALPNR